MMDDAAMQPAPAHPGEARDGRPAAVARSVDELAEVLRIRDPGLKAEAVLERVLASIQSRLAAGGYGPDVAKQGPAALRATPSEDAGEDLPALLLRSQEAVESLAAASAMREPEFQSRVPVLGPLIVALRRFWNWMSARWYVRGWMAQQQEFNAQVVNAMAELLHAQAESERRIHELERQLEQGRREGEGAP
jgi:hypothetical protein